VYGTVAEAGANRYAAEQLQARYQDGAQIHVPVYKDFEVSDDRLQHSDVVFVGRPETNSAVSAWAAKVGLDYTGAMFKLEGKTYASERDSLVLAAKNPLDPAHMVLLYAGNAPLQTVEALNTDYAISPTVVLEDGKSPDAPARPRRR
jgi:hypothetical protein